MITHIQHSTPEFTHVKNNQFPPRHIGVKTTYQRLPFFDKWYCQVRITIPTHLQPYWNFNRSKTADYFIFRTRRGQLTSALLARTCTKLGSGFGMSTVDLNNCGFSLLTYLGGGLLEMSLVSSTGVSFKRLQISCNVLNSVKSTFLSVEIFFSLGNFR